LAVLAANRSPEKTLYVTDTAAEIGHGGTVAGLLEVAKAVFCLEREILPSCHSVMNFGFPTDRSTRPANPQHWLRNRVEGPRQAAVLSATPDGWGFQVLLVGHDKPKTVCDREEKGNVG
jgi:acyl transferase domain-containing protein